MNWYFLCACRVIHQLSSTLIDPVDRVTPELVDGDAVVTHEIISWKLWSVGSTSSRVET